MGRGVVGSHDSSDGSDKGLEETLTFWKEILRDLWLMGSRPLSSQIGFNNYWLRRCVNSRIMSGVWSDLTVQPWTLDFNSLQPYPSVIMTWIRLLGLPGFLYKRKILEEISGLISRVVKLDSDTDNRSKGKFARMSVFMNLDKPLIPQVLVNGRAKRVEYEALISTQLEAKSGNADSSTLGDLQKESINLEQ
ncbi:hypothetical protein PVK06_012390 [Gossypium arboreum]|uniref:DUF4283 domain-containing protein n=1 Tax=Gossypium arboreum TaxID=29729 RepID=A0ABR0QBN2_GOSAR|nr:hypothetical protein PVK06_012390 [Gossypium arboreum]